MFEIDDNQELDGTEVEEPVSAEALDGDVEADVSEDAPADPWEEARAELGDADPKEVAKTWKQYTQRMQDLAEKERTYAPLQEIQDAFRNDPEFAQYVSKYADVKESSKTAEDIAREATERVNNLTFRMETERTISALRDKVKSKTLDGFEGVPTPDFNDTELFDFAASHHIGDLESAYVAMKAKDIAKAVKESTLADLKRKKEAGVVTKVKGSPVGGSASLADLQSMSDSDFASFAKPK